MQAPRIADSNQSASLTRVALDKEVLIPSNSEEAKRLKEILQFSLTTTGHGVSELKKITFRATETRLNGLDQKKYDLEQRILRVIARQIRPTENGYPYHKDKELLKTIDALTSQMSELTAHLSQLNT